MPEWQLLTLCVELSDTEPETVAAAPERLTEDEGDRDTLAREEPEADHTREPVVFTVLDTVLVALAVMVTVKEPPTVPVLQAVSEAVLEELTVPEMEKVGVLDWLTEPEVLTLRVTRWAEELTVKLLLLEALTVEQGVEVLLTRGLALLSPTELLAEAVAEAGSEGLMLTLTVPEGL